MAKSSTPSYTVEYALAFDSQNPMSVLQKLDKIAISIYNDVLGEGLKRLHKLQHDFAYKNALEEYRKLRKKSKPTKKDKLIMEQLLDIMNSASQQYAFSEYELQKYAKTGRDHFHDALGAHECQKLATRAYKALYKLKIGKAEKVNFKSTKHGVISIENKDNITGIHFDRENLCVVYGKPIYNKVTNKVEKKYYHFPIIIKKNDQYAMQALQDRVKYVRLQPRKINGKLKWFAQLVFEGYPPQKGNHVYGSEKTTVGLDIGVSTLATSSDKEAHLIELAPECVADERKIRILSRKMDRSKHATNPQNFKEDGTIKKAPKGKKFKWNYSKEYEKTRDKRAKLYRKTAVKRKESHEWLANQIVAMGTDIRVEEMNFKALQKRSKNTTTNKSGKYNSKKRYGKTLGNRAPAKLLEIINRKLSYKGYKLKKINTREVKASQYNPLSETYQRKDLKDRMIEVMPGIIVQRDMLSAFIIAHTNKNLRSINKKSCKRDFAKFKKLQDQELDYLRQNNQLSWYIS